MPTHNFRLIVKGPDLHGGPVLDALYEGGCDDALVVSSDGVQYLEFNRAAPTIEVAIRSAVADVESVDKIKVVGIIRGEAIP